MWVRASDCDSNTCPEVQFIKASGCEAGSCPEVGYEGGTILFRDSEDPDTVVKVKPQSWQLFLAAVKRGEFDLK